MEVPMKKVVFLCLTVFFLQITFLLPKKILASTLPLDLAFARKSLPHDGGAALSPDGRFLVYGVHTPPVKSPGSEMQMEPRYLPNGTPTSALGVKLYITEVSTGKTKLLFPGTGNSWRPSWSPDNKRVAFYCDAGGFPQLWIYDVIKEKAKRISNVKIKAKLWPGDEAYWHPSGKEIYIPVDLSPGDSLGNQVQKHGPPPEGPGQGPTVSVYRSGAEVIQTPDEKIPAPDADEEFFVKENNAALAALPIDPGEIRIVVPADTTPRPAVLRLSPTGKYVSYLSVFRIKNPDSFKLVHDLVIVPAAGGPILFKALDLDVGELDYYGLTYRWHPTKDRLVYIKDKKPWYVDINEGKNLSAQQLAPGLGEVTHSPLAFTPDGKGVLIGINPIDDLDYTDPRPTSLALIDIESNQSKIISLEKELFFRGVLRTNSRILWQPERGTCTFLMENPATGEHSLIRCNLKNGKGKTIWKGLARFTFFGSDNYHKSMVGIFENAQTPPDFYCFNADFSQKNRLSQVEPRLDKIEVGPVITFEIPVPSYNGGFTRATSALFLPPWAKKGDKCPTIVFVYGGGRLSRSMNRFGGGSPATVPILLFTSRGYAVLLPDMRISPEGKPGNPFQEMIDVLLPQVYHSVAIGYTDVERLLIIGQSYGGYGVAAIISGTNLFKAAAAISGFYDLPGMYGWMEKGGNRSIFQYTFEKGQGRMGAHPWENLKRYIANSPYYQADKINTPLLMLHGANDSTCPVEDAQKMFNALQRLGKTTQLAVYTGEGHVISTWSLVNAVDAYQRILAFLEKYL